MVAGEHQAAGRDPVQHLQGRHQLVPLAAGVQVAAGRLQRHVQPGGRAVVGGRGVTPLSYLDGALVGLYAQQEVTGVDDLVASVHLRVQGRVPADIDPDNVEAVLGLERVERVFHHSAPVGPSQAALESACGCGCTDASSSRSISMRFSISLTDSIMSAAWALMSGTRT